MRGAVIEYDSEEELTIVCGSSVRLAGPTCALRKILVGTHFSRMVAMSTKIYCLASAEPGCPACRMHFAGDADPTLLQCASSSPSLLTR